MARCAHCGRSIVFGGKKEQGYRFCRDACRKNAMTMLAVERYLELVPPEVIEAEIRFVHQGSCPRCGGEGPVDIHTSYTVWATLVRMGMEDFPTPCCRHCGRRAIMVAVIKSILVGVLCLPVGLVFLPFILVANLIRFLRPPRLSEPSARLRTLVTRNIAYALMQRKFWWK